MKKNVLLIVIALIIVGGSFMFLRSKDSDTTSTNQTKLRYVALGDSVSAGVGLPTASDSSACDRTDESYPNGIAKTLNYDMTNISCSGATMSAGILGGQDVNKLVVRAQIEQLFSQTKPDIITITIGANDSGWTNTIAKCFTSVCGDSADGAALDVKFTQLTSDIKDMLSRIKDHYGDSAPHIVLVGYYAVFSQMNTTCADTTSIEEPEATWINLQLGKLNEALNSATQGFAFAKYAPLHFENHELCTTATWIQRFTDRKPFHPNEEGQAAIAKQISEIIKNL